MFPCSKHVFEVLGCKLSEQAADIETVCQGRRAWLQRKSVPLSVLLCL